MIYALWFAFLLLKLGLAAWYPLFADEMYYRMWAQFPSLSYFDHPPFVAWLLKVGLPLDFLGSAIRWPLVIFGHLSLLIWIFILRDLLNARQLITFVLLFSLAPLTGLGSIIATPDVPLLVFWSLSVLALKESLRTGSWAWFFALGLSAGFGFVSKYHMALLLPLVLALFVLERRPKSDYLKLSFAVMIAGVAAWPVLLWNFQNDWISFRFQLSRGLGRPTEVSWIFEYIGAQLALMLPGLGLAAFWASKNRKSLFFSLLGWGPILFFLISSFKGRVEPNWTTVAYPSLFVLAIYAGDRFSSLIKMTWRVWLVGTVLLLSHLAFRWLPLDDRSLKLNEHSAFDAYIPIFQDYGNVYASSYQMASTLSKKLQKPIFKLQGINRMDHYDLMPQSKPPEGTSFLLFHSAWNQFPEWLKEGYTYEHLLEAIPQDMYLTRFTPRVRPE